MSFIEVLAIAVALSVDAVVVALCWSALQQRIRLNHVLQFSVVFGGFQALMPVIGWFAGVWIINYIEAWDHWVAFLLLAWVAYSMVKEAMEEKTTKDEHNGTPEANSQLISISTLLVMAIATSIDALAIGFSFAVVQMPIVMPSLTIGLVCAVLTALSMSLGRALNNHIQRHTKKMSYVGALVLLLIGVKILMEHNVFA